MSLYEEVENLKPGSIFTVGPTGKIGYIRTTDGIADLAAVEHQADATVEIPDAWKALAIGIKVRFTHKGGWAQ